MPKTRQPRRHHFPHDLEVARQAIANLDMPIVAQEPNGFVKFSSSDDISRSARDIIAKILEIEIVILELEIPLL